MNLSRFFTLEEMIFSNKAKELGIDNTPTAGAIESLRALCTAVLDPLREAVGSSIKINSGYRGPTLNARVGGEAKSQHLAGQAADIVAPAMPVVETFKKAIQLGLPYDQLIYEIKPNSKWVHVSHNPGANKGEILLAQPNAAGKMTYTRLTAAQALAMSEPVSRSRSAAVDSGYVEGADEPEHEEPKSTVTEKAPAAVAKKVAAKPVAVKKAVAKKVTAKKPVAKKPAAKKAVAKKVAAKKVAAKKVATKKAVAKKSAAKKVAVKKVPAKKMAVKKTTVKKAVAKKAAVKKPARKASR